MWGGVRVGGRVTVGVGVDWGVGVGGGSARMVGSEGEGEAAGCD